jgi:RadC-like JAB domain
MNMERGYPFSLVSFAEAVSARSERLREIDGLGEAAIVELKIVEAAAKRIAKSAIEKRLTLSTFGAVVDYCRTAMAFLDHEEFRVLFLDKKNCLIADEVQGVGTVDHAPVYPREIMRRALGLSAAPTWSTELALSTALATGSQGLNPSGFIGGGQVGYNYQFAPSWVVGIEADIQGIAGSNPSSSFSGSGIPVGFPAETIVSTAISTKQIDYLVSRLSIAVK